MEQTKQKVVNLSYRELKIAYMVDGHTIQKLAEAYNIEWSDMKQALRDYGFTCRNETKPMDNPKPYKVVLIDTDKIVKREETQVKTNSVVVS